MFEFLNKDIKLNTNTLIISEIIFIFCASLSLQLTSQSLWFGCFFIVSLFQLVLHIVYLYRLEHKKITFPIFFTLLSYVFHFGHLPIKAFGMEFGKNVLFPLWYVDFSIYKKAAIFSLLSQTMLVLGMLFIYHHLYKRKENKLISCFKDISLDKIKIIGIVCIAIGIIPTLYIDISKLILFFKGGYINTYNLNVRDFVEVIADFFNFGIFALMIGYSNEKKVANSIFLTAIVYKVIMMSSGGRGEAIVFLLGLFIVWENCVMRLSGKQIILLIVAGYFGLVLLNFIANVRNIQNVNIVGVARMFVYSLTNNQLVAALSEFGSTFATVCFTIESNPKASFGLNYILPILLVIPNIGGFNSRVVKQMIFTNHIYTYKQPIGGSYIAELFYSFHWFGWLFAFVLGVFIGYISYQLMCQRKEKNHFMYLLFAYTMPLLFFWIRGYFGAIYRTLIWHCGFAIIFVYVMRYMQKKRKGENV